MEVIQLTETAKAQALELLQAEQKKEPESNFEGLRVKVIGGGCSGLQYKLGFDSASEEDEIFEHENGLIVMVDPKSAPHLQGATLEFHNTISQTGFEVLNPNACGTCGCGKSFS